MKVLGVSCDYHDAAAAVVMDGVPVAAAEQERFSRHKHDAELPVDAIASVLAIAGLTPDDLDAVVFHEKPLGVISRVLAARQRRGLRGVMPFVREFPHLIGTNLMIGWRLERALRQLGATRSPTLRYCEHHVSHAAAAYYPSPFEDAAILTIDALGEWDTVTIGQGQGHRIDLLWDLAYPDSLGLLYSLITVWCGFRPNDGEYKLMGLAPFGKPIMRSELDEFVSIESTGAIHVDLEAVGWWEGDPNQMPGLVERFGPQRDPASPLIQRHADMAASIQQLTEDVVLRLAEHAHSLTKADSVCLAGGVALNCVANGRLRDEGPFGDVWVQPAAGDAGSALGAALWFAHLPGDDAEEPTRGHDMMRGAALGPRFWIEEIIEFLDEHGVEYELCARHDRDAEVASLLATGCYVGWFCGPMEFGPRALGHRSILADPRSADAQRMLNVKVKGRESFRPFAPAVLTRHLTGWFDSDVISPYMLFTQSVAAHRLIVPSREEGTLLTERVAIPRSQIPACTHVDNSARVQTIDPEYHPDFAGLVEAFHSLTDCPVLLNTSFNLAGEPIVCTPADALDTAIRGRLDALVIETALIRLSDKARDAGDWEREGTT